jgi:hypothetical protein
MRRPKYALGFLLAPVVFTILFLGAACGGGGPERPTIDKFFRSAKLRDNGTLAGISMVAFDPGRDGTVDSFSVVSVSDVTSTPLHLKELAQAHADAKAADDELNKKQLEFQKEHADELNKLLDAEQAGTKLRGKEVEFQAVWNKWKEDRAASARKVSLAREALLAQSAVADISTYNPQSPIDASNSDGTLNTKTYTIDANITTPEQQHVKKTLVLTLEQVVLNGDTGEIPGRWIITKIETQAAAGA